MRDFIILHYCLSRRDDSPFWQQCAQAGAARQRSRSASRCIAPPAASSRRGPELFSDLDWFWVFEGSGVTPRDYDPLVDTVDFEQVKRLMLAISQKVSADPAAAPSHDSFFAAGECAGSPARARPPPRPQRTADTCHPRPNYSPASSWAAPSACASSAPGPTTCARSSACRPASARKRCARSKPCSIAGVRNTARRARSASPRSARSTCAPGSPTYGYITSTTKAGWRNTDVAQRLGRRVGVPVGFDTDVNGAALAEGRWGAARGLEDFAYVTVGTGIGVGSIVRGRSVFGMNHTELGHIRVARKSRRQISRRLPVSRRLHRRAGVRARPSKRAPACRPRNCRPIIRPGISSRTGSRNCCTPWC